METPAETTPISRQRPGAVTFLCILMVILTGAIYYVRQLLWQATGGGDLATGNPTFFVFSIADAAITLIAAAGYFFMKKWAVVVYGVWIGLSVIFSLAMRQSPWIGLAPLLILISMWNQWRKGILS